MASLVFTKLDDENSTRSLFGPVGAAAPIARIRSLRKWESLDDQRFCRCCHKFISGRQIEVSSTPGKPLRLVCPTTDCSATVLDLVYPNEVAPPHARGRRVL